MVVPRLGRRERSRSYQECSDLKIYTGATEDDASGRPARPCDSASLRRAVLVVRAALFDAVDDRAARALEALLDPLQASVDALPAGRDEVDQEREVVEAGAPLGEQLRLDVLEPANGLAGQPAHLGHLAGDGQRLGAD